MSSTTFAEAPSAVFTCSYPPPVRLERGKSRAELRARLLEVLNAKVSAVFFITRDAAKGIIPHRFLEKY